MSALQRSQRGVLAHYLVLGFFKALDRIWMTCFPLRDLLFKLFLCDLLSNLFPRMPILNSGFIDTLGRFVTLTVLVPKQPGGKMPCFHASGLHLCPKH